MKVVLDTNVLVSALLTPRGACAAIIRLAFTGAIAVCYDERILDEYRDVLQRPRFSFDVTAIESVIAFIRKTGLDVIVTRPLHLHLPDPDDEPFLEVAIAAEADGLVTGNKKHFPRTQRYRVKILSPIEFLESYGEQSSGQSGKQPFRRLQ